MNPRLLPLVALTAPALAGDCTPIGSDAITRPIFDSSSGLVLIYRGDGQPVAGPSSVGEWTFFSSAALNQWVTPLLFRVDGSTYTLVGVGESRMNAATGVQTHPFGLTTGSAELAAGDEFTFGFTTRRLAAGAAPGQITTLTSSGGVIPFNGYGIFTDPWDYAVVPQLSIGQQFGPGAGQVPMNNLGFTGRTYSANFTLDCTCPADLAPPAGTLNFFDVSAFLGAYNTQSPQADFAAPFGTFNFFDVSAFLAAYNAGCP